VVVLEVRLAPPVPVPLLPAVEHVATAATRPAAAMTPSVADRIGPNMLTDR
jgi:hypothetical protein